MHTPDSHVINASYYCERNRPGGPILVLTTGAYVVAEYDERTGNATWQRVVQANQSATIEHWLYQHYPPKTAAAARKQKQAGKETRSASVGR